MVTSVNLTQSRKENWVTFFSFELIAVKTARNIILCNSFFLIVFKEPVAVPCHRPRVSQRAVRRVGRPVRRRGLHVPRRKVQRGQAGGQNAHQALCLTRELPGTTWCWVSHVSNFQFPSVPFTSLVLRTRGASVLSNVFRCSYKVGYRSCSCVLGVPCCSTCLCQWYSLDFFLNSPVATGNFSYLLAVSLQQTEEAHGKTNEEDFQAVKAEWGLPPDASEWALSSRSRCRPWLSLFLILRSFLFCVQQNSTGPQLYFQGNGSE